MSCSVLSRAGRSLVVCALATSLLAVTGCGRGGGQAGFANRVPNVGVVVIHYQPTLLTTELPGRTSPYQEADVRPQVNGILIKRLFEEGGTVKAGQALYQIDPAPYQAAFDSAKAAVANAEANLATTRAKSERYANLLKQNAIAPQDYDDALAASKQAQANVLQAQANLESARINLDYTKITAPVSGRIGRSLVTVGALVTANQTNVLATIDTLDPIYVDINQSSSELLALKKALAAGQLSGGTPETARVALILEDGSTYPLDGTLKFSEASVDPNTGAVVLRAVFPNPKGLLLPGMYVRARIAEGVDPRAILAPQQGVSRNEKGEPTAMVVDNHGVAQLRILQSSQAVGNAWLITSGLAPGDKLIVDGLQSVQPGAPVHAVPAAAQQPATGS
ncbi:MAG TPA: efflux RND transporter periplasmic adaptor subunit [Rhizomicrobium sp.]|nr:efflux RND transporter periplasmic adaptor subunit [Rhizomicrobium sp.]